MHNMRQQSSPEELAIKPLWLGMTAWAFSWLVLGGLAYTGGVAFYAAHKVRYAHFIWHLFVMAGTASHVMAVMLTLNN